MSETVAELWKYVTEKWFAVDSFLISKGLNLWTVILVLALILIAFTLLRFLLKLKKQRKISLLVSKGEIRQGRDFKPVLSLRLSNLNKMPLQVLELSLDSDSMPMPQIIELAELVGPDEVIPIEAQFDENIIGENGVLHLFAYLPKRANQLYRLKANFSYEPWAGRYKVSPFKQSIKKVRQLDSELVSKSKTSHLNQKLMERSRSEIEAITEPVEVVKQKPIKDKPGPKRANNPDLKDIEANRPNLVSKAIQEENKFLVPKPRQKKDLKFPKDF